MTQYPCCEPIEGSSIFRLCLLPDAEEDEEVQCANGGNVPRQKLIAPDVFGNEQSWVLSDPGEIAVDVCPVTVPPQGTALQTKDCRPI